MLRVGTRGSQLALAQTRLVTSELAGTIPDITIEEVVAANDPTIMDKSRYVNAIEEQLRSEEVDFGVHSAKDIPGEEAPGLVIAAVPERADAADILLGATSLDEVAEGATVGTSSLRRAAQLLSVRPDLKIDPLRGNIDSRIEHLQAGEYDAIVLAAAGLDRLSVGRDIAQARLDFITAPGQGCLAVQIREIDLATAGLVGALTHMPSERELTAERATSAGLIASCNTPLGVNAVVEEGAGEGGKDKITVRGWVGLPDGTRYVEDAVSGLASEAKLLGHLLSQRLRAEGGEEILQLAEEMAA